jgi:hypothetical protein
VFRTSPRPASTFRAQSIPASQCAPPANLKPKMKVATSNGASARAWYSDSISAMFMGSRRAERIIEANQPSLPALTSPVQPIMRDRPTAAGNVRIGDRLERLLGTSKNIPYGGMTGVRVRSAVDRSILGLSPRLPEVATGFSGCGLIGSTHATQRVARRFTRPRPPSFQDKRSGACCRRGSSFRFCTARERCR